MAIRQPIMQVVWLPSSYVTKVTFNEELVVGKVEGKSPPAGWPSQAVDRLIALTGLSVTIALREAENRTKWKMIE